MRRMLVAVLAACGAACALVSAQLPTFRSRVEAVRVDVLVTEHGRPVRGLQPADFEILDNGVRQHVDLAILEKLPLDLILVFDVSKSVEGQRLDDLRRAGGAVLGALAPGDRAALVTFNHVVRLGSGLTSELGRLRAALALAMADGGTALVDGAFAGMMLGESEVGRALELVFSDGLDVSSWLTADAVLDTARRSGVVVYGTWVGPAQAPEFLRALARATGGDVVSARSSQDVGAIFLHILEEFRNRYVLSYSPQGVSKAGWHALDVRVKGRGFQVKARPGYLAGGEAPRP